MISMGLGNAVAAGKVSERIRRYARYAGVVVLQGEALEKGDLDSFGALLDEREELQRELEKDPDPDDGNNEKRGHDDEQDVETRELLQKVTDDLRVAAAVDEKIAKKLRAMRHDTAVRIRSLQSRRPKLTAYASNENHGAPQRPRINIKL